MKWIVISVAAALLLIAGALLAAWLVLRLQESQDVRGSSTEEFVPTAEPRPKPPPEPGIAWPTWGFDNLRVRVSPYRHRPPFRRLWTFRARTLLEFPPVIAYGKAYVTNNSGVTFAVHVKTGDLAWRHKSGRCVASTPTVAGGLLVQSYLNAPPCNSKRSPSRLEGRVVALDARSGRVRWRARLGPSESSPLVAGRTVYVGDWRGDVYALDLRTGRRRWSFHTDGRVKGAAALVEGRLLVGSYDGRLYALDARTGRLRWKAASQSGLRGRGQFYSTPAVAYGRVYIGSTDGKVYSFGAASGALLWSQSTGGYVYSSPAVWKRRVYAGSYSGKVFALDAATGDVVWEEKVNGPVSGAPTVMAGLVYVATLKDRTYALDARTGRRIWSFGDGKYSPLVADRERAYVVGHTRVYALDPR